MTLRSIVHEGHEVSIAHLAPLRFDCPCADLGRALTVGAVFLNHCYTRAFDPGEHAPGDVVVHDGGGPKGGRGRVFDPVRHALSFNLPAIVAGLADKRVHQTARRRNYVHAVPAVLAGQLYAVFFALRRAPPGRGSDLLLTVESAYPTPGGLALPRRPGAIRFGVLAFKTFKGEPVRFAPR